MDFFRVLKLLGVYALLSLSGLCSKWASGGAFLSWRYVLGLAGAVGVLGLYALIWQKILKQVPLATAYMFKGSGVVFMLLYSTLLFGERLSGYNLVGALLIIAGITLYAREEKA